MKAHTASRSRVITLVEVIVAGIALLAFLIAATHSLNAEAVGQYPKSENFLRVLIASLIYHRQNLDFDSPIDPNTPMRSMAHCDTSHAPE
jgi:hypothetical protein